MDLSGLSAVLWWEREVLDALLYRLDVQQLLSRVEPGAHAGLCSAPMPCGSYAAGH
jgi:hypothetical protein